MLPLQPRRAECNAIFQLHFHVHCSVSSNQSRQSGVPWAPLGLSHPWVFACTLIMTFSHKTPSFCPNPGTFHTFALLSIFQDPFQVSPISEEIPDFPTKCSFFVLFLSPWELAVCLLESSTASILHCFWSSVVSSPKCRIINPLRKGTMDSSFWYLLHPAAQFLVLSSC